VPRTTNASPAAPVTHAKTRRVRFRAEWIEELPSDPEPGDRVAVPFRELVVRSVVLPRDEALAALAESQELRTPVRFAHTDYSGDDSTLARLAPTLVEPGATWRATARLQKHGLRQGNYCQGDGWYDLPPLERGAATLAEALDAFPAWAEEWLALDLSDPTWDDDDAVRGLPKLTGSAELAIVEPGGPDYGRAVLRTWLGTTDKPRGPEFILGALEALCAEAERLYGGAERPEPARVDD
jgi:hypothetical protein